MATRVDPRKAEQQRQRCDDERAVAEVRAAVAAGLHDRGPVLLAVSGGADSMTLLDAAVHAARESVVAVATFDHGTGDAARAAVTLVRARAESLGVPLHVGRAAAAAAGCAERGDEAAWRAARWQFLRAHAVRLGARVATAHTLDDQVETVAMRVLRGAGARGLAALAADGPVLRPMLAVTGATVDRYVRSRDLPQADDPSNRSRRHLRNRLRLDLLPALERAQPGFSAALLTIGARAAEWRRELETVVDEFGAPDIEGRAFVASLSLREYDPAALGVLWPALAARARVTLDWRGTRRVAAFTTSARPGAVMPLSGGAHVERTRDGFRIVPPLLPQANGSAARGIDAGTAGEAATAVQRGAQRLGRSAALVIDGFRFHAAASGGTHDERDLWRAVLPDDATLLVRRWQPGDRMRAAGGNTARRVKRFLSDARVPTGQRPGWPVVLADDEIVWIPGVRRADAASDRSGRPGLPFLCDRFHL